MRNIFAIITVLILLTACEPSTTVSPAVQPDDVVNPQISKDTVKEAGPTAGVVHEVTIKSFKCFPPTIVIKAGDTVKWTNEDAAPHDATGDGWNTALLRKGQSDSVTFDTPGTYDYICSIHPYMKAKVVVE